MSPWTAGLVLQAILVFVLLAKKMWQRFPIFFVYSGISFIFDLVLYSIFHFFSLIPTYHSIYATINRPYMTTYWLSEGIGLVLGLAVVYEVFKHLFTPYPALRKLARHSLQAAMALLAILGCVVAYFQPGGATQWGESALYAVEQATRILEVGLLLSLFVLASAFGLHWRQYVFGMAVGLGVFTAVELVAVTMRLQFGVNASSTFNMIRAVSFNTSLLIWIGYILVPELKQSPKEMPKRAQLEQWNRAITELIYQ